MWLGIRGLGKILLTTGFFILIIFTFITVLTPSCINAQNSENIDRIAEPIKYKSVRACTGNEIIDFSKGVSLSPGFITDSPGLILGTTWYDYQTNGSTGNRIAVCDDGTIYTSWMRGFNWPIPPRHIYHNWRDISSTWSFADTGKQVDDRPHAQAAAGYTTLDIYQGYRGAIAYHYTLPAYFGRLAIDDVDTVGNGNIDRFYVPNIVGNDTCGWPYITIDLNDKIHMILTELDPTGSDTQTVIYTRSSDGGTSWISPIIVDTIRALSTICVASKVSSKVAIVYTHPISYETQWNNNVYYIESQDGITWDFSVKNNITNYSSGDNIRAYADLDAIYDMNDNLHIIWNSPHYGTGDPTECYLWHWSQQSGTDMIASAWWPSNPGGWNVSISKMSIGCDFNSNLFAVWSQFTNSDVAANGFSNGEIYWSYSSNGGNNWMAAVNLTNSATPGCSAGNCDSDHWPSLAEKVGENLHIVYINDKDAGGIPQTEGTATENPVLYLEVENPLWPGAIIGTVMDQELVPIENVYVEVEGTDVNDSTDTNGDYILKYLNPGSYNVSFSTPNYQDTTIFGVTVNRGDTTTLTVFLNDLPCSYYISNCSFDETLYSCPGGDVAYKIVIRDANNNPIENCDDFFLDFSNCTVDYYCASNTTWPYVEPIGPSNSSGELYFYPQMGRITSGTVDVWATYDLLYTIDSFMSFDVNGDTVVNLNDWTGGPENDYNLDGFVDWEDYDIFHYHIGHHCETPPALSFSRYMRSDPPSGYLVEGDTALISLIVTNNSSVACSVNTVKYSYLGFNIGGGNWQEFSVLNGLWPMEIGQTDTFTTEFIIPSAGHGCLQSWMFLESYPDSFRTQINLDSQGQHGGGVDSSLCEAEIGDAYGFPIWIFVIESLPYGWSYTISDTIFYDVGTLYISVIPWDSAAPGDRGSITAVGIDTLGNEIGSIICEYIVPGGGACDYVVGDINGDGLLNGLDVVYGVNYFKGGDPPICPECPADDCNSWYYCGDTNGDCAYNGLDVGYLVRFLKGIGPAPVPCPDCPPIGLAIITNYGHEMQAIEIDTQTGGRIIENEKSKDRIILKINIRSKLKGKQ